MIKKELMVFLTAVTYYTRIPTPKWVEYSQKHLDHSIKYFPLVGWIVGGIASIVFMIAQKFFPVSICVLLSMISSVLLTGALHEDGFADVCDGFGGGTAVEQKLKIMNDSRLGAYGTIGIVFLLLFKYISLAEINPSYTPMLIFSGHCLSRFAVTVFRYSHRYVKNSENTKARPMSQNMTLKSLIIASFFGIAPLILLRTKITILLLISVLLAEFLLAKYFEKKIGGYTGDCLGAMQQVTEVIYYLSFLLLWTYI